MSGHGITRFHDARLADGRRVDLLVRDAARAHERPCARVRAAVHLGGRLALPALVDGHVHLDGTLLALPRHAHAAGAERASRVETEKHLRRRTPPGAPATSGRRPSAT